MTADKALQSVWSITLLSTTVLFVIVAIRYYIGLEIKYMLNLSVILLSWCSGSLFVNGIIYRVKARRGREKGAI